MDVDDDPFDFELIDNPETKSTTPFSTATITAVQAISPTKAQRVSLHVDLDRTETFRANDGRVFYRHPAQVLYVRKDGKETSIALHDIDIDVGLPEAAKGDVVIVEVDKCLRKARVCSSIYLGSFPPNDVILKIKY